jgi:hypothetical protein
MSKRDGRSRDIELLPQARKEELVIRELPDEVLVYDLKRHEAHCLNQTAAIVWKNCDGKTTLSRMAAVLGESLVTPVGEDLVRLALARLDRAHLLERPIPQIADGARASRRELIRRLGLASAVALPLVTSIIAPMAVHAATGITAEACMKLIRPQCLTPIPCVDTNGKQGNCQPPGAGNPDMSCQCVPV